MVEPVEVYACDIELTGLSKQEGKFVSILYTKPVGKWTHTCLGLLLQYGSNPYLKHIPKHILCFFFSNHKHCNCRHYHQNHSYLCPIIIQVFTIQVTWTDCRRFKVYRRYGEFFTLQVYICEHKCLVISLFYVSGQSHHFFPKWSGQGKLPWSRYSFTSRSANTTVISCNVNSSKKAVVTTVLILVE